MTAIVMYSLFEKYSNTWILSQNSIKLIKELVEHELTQKLRTKDTWPLSKPKHTYLQCNINGKLYVSDINFKFLLIKEPTITLEQVEAKGTLFFPPHSAFLWQILLTLSSATQGSLPLGSVIVSPFLDLGPFSLFTENS